MAELIIESDIAITNSGDFDIIERDINLIGGEELSAQEIFRIFREDFDITPYLGGSSSNMISIANDIENDLAIIIDNNHNAYGEDLIVNVVPTEDVDQFKIKISSISDEDDNVYEESFSIEGGSFSDTNPEFIEEQDILTDESAPFFEILTVTEEISLLPLAGVPSSAIFIIEPDNIDFNGTFDIDIPEIIETKTFASVENITMDDNFHEYSFFKEILEVYNEVGEEIEYELDIDNVITFIDYAEYTTINITLSYYDIIDKIDNITEVKKSDTIRDNLNLIYPFRKITNTKACQTNIALTAGKYVLYYERLI